LLLASVVGALGTAAVLAIPGKYEAHAQIYVDTKSVLKPLLQGLAVTNQAPDETDVVRRALLARPNLDRVARKVGIYSRAGTPEGAERLLAELTRLIEIHGDSSTGLYTISYRDPDPRTAQALVQNLLDTFVANSIGEGRTDTRNAEAFLAQQVSEYERRLSRSEQRLADFKQQNIGLMPDERGGYFARLQTELAARDKLRTDLAVALRQREALRGKLTGDGHMVPEGAPAPTDRQIRAAEALDARIHDARSALGVLLEKFTEEHPQVRAQREMIRHLEEQRQAELGIVRKTNAAVTADSPVAVDPVVQNLQIGLNTADLQVAALRAQLGRSEAKEAELQRMVTTGPQIEAELARLNRDYGVTKAEYEALLQRLESARISHDADRSEELRFKVLEPARVPIRPAKPDRPLLLAAVLLAAIGAGGAVAVLRAQTQPVFFSKASLVATLKLPVIGTVSSAPSARQLAARRGEYFVYGSAAAILVAVIVLAALFSFSVSNALRQLMGGQG
jgi:polysaccharide chain length determinant protein (PEP-CTERM system associated)